MKNRARTAALGALFGLSLHVYSLSAQDKDSQAQNPSPSLQQQIDDLKAGQQRVLRELEEIKKLLQEKQPGRGDYPVKPASPTVIPLNVHGEPFRGDNRARIAIMEYSDFECSFCVKYVREIYPRIDEDYIRPGKVKYFFRDLPAPEHTNSLAKARAARCAGEHGKFWEMHDRLFVEPAAPAGQNLTSYAEALGLDLEKFGECLSSGRYAENIRRSAAGAARMGIYGTPGFLIGTVSPDGDFLWATKVLVGGDSYAPIKAALDELLASEPK